MQYLDFHANLDKKKELLASRDKNVNKLPFFYVLTSFLLLIHL